jgi:succinate semialdehyde reductase
MYTIKQPNQIFFGYNSVQKFQFPKNCLLITSKGAKKRNWLDYINLENMKIFDQVENNPSVETAKTIINKWKDHNIAYVVGLGGGSCLDVAKFVGYKLKKPKILIPTTFGSGSEVTRISVLKVNGKKQSFHDDELFADIAIVDPYFLSNTPENVFKNSVIDACAQCSESFDSKNSNLYTKFLCKTAFEKLEHGIFNNDNESIVLGSLYTGLGFGNSSTTLGHALSYVFSNEGISHGHALAYTTTIAHKFNNSIFYERFLEIVKKLNFQPINLKQNLNDAAELILSDKKHLDNNPKIIQKNDIIDLLKKLNEYDDVSDL